MEATLATRHSDCPASDIYPWDAYEHAHRFLHPCIFGASRPRCATGLRRGVLTEEIASAGALCQTKSQSASHACRFLHPCAGGPACNSDSLHFDHHFHICKGTGVMLSVS
jgi:hypothetical protein